MRPNILFVFPDQWRADWTGMNRCLPIRTPNLVRLAEHGVWFPAAFTPSPLCAPARATLASGLEYDLCGVPNNSHDYPLGQLTFYALLREAGYHVMGCGKFDLAKAAFGWKTDGSSRLAEWGFDEGIDSEGKWDGVTSGRVEPRGPYMTYLEERGLRLMHVEDMLQRRSSKLATFPTPLPDDAYSDNWIAANGLRLIASAPGHKPWFLQVNFTGPHDPWDITVAMAEMYRNVDFPIPLGVNPEQVESHLAVRRNYAAMIENIDHWLGAFLDALSESGQLSKTLIVVSSDHGEMLGDRSCWGKAAPFQASLAVPLVVSGPGVYKRAVLKTPTTILDLAGTFLDFAGVTIPATWDTRSLRKNLEDPEARPPRNHVLSALPEWQLVLDGRFKLVKWQDRTELFDVMTDPTESTNVATFHPSTVQSMSTLLRRDAGARRLVFIGGAEGSGTTLLLRLLSAPDVCASLGGNFVKVPEHGDARLLAQAFEEANRRLWDRKLSYSDHEIARRDWHAAADQILNSPAFSSQTCVLFKRSFPFAQPRDQYTPDIWDALDLLARTRIVVIYRDPCAATFSALRRGFDSDLRRLAVACSEQLTWLAGQVRAIGPDLVRIISYRGLCEDPVATLAPLVEFCGIPFAPVRAAALSERMDVGADRRYTRELQRSEVDWLEGFFDTRRRRQWDILESGRATPSWLGPQISTPE
jgi:arylsulfatase